MRVTIVEICKTTDKDASFFVKQNEQQGLDIIEYQNKYYTYIYNPPCWRSEDAEFRTGFEGTWIFKE